MRARPTLNYHSGLGAHPCPQITDDLPIYPASNITLHFPVPTPPSSHSQPVCGLVTGNTRVTPNPLHPQHTRQESFLQLREELGNTSTRLLRELARTRDGRNSSTTVRKDMHMRTEPLPRHSNRSKLSGSRTPFPLTGLCTPLRAVSSHTTKPCANTTTHGRIRGHYPPLRRRLSPRRNPGLLTNCLGLHLRT